MRRNHNYVEESKINKLIRISAKHDKQVYLEVELSTGKWDAIKQLRRGLVVKDTNLRNPAGQLVETSERPDTMAKYFASIQWKNQFASAFVCDLENIREELPVCCDHFTSIELDVVLQKLKYKTAYF